MMDLQSILGYSKGSPYANNPYLDIHTPEGLIDMSNTPFDLLGVDNLGNKKRMKAGRKNPYKFEGSIVRETPMQKGGKPKIVVTNPNKANIPINDTLAFPEGSMYEYYRNKAANRLDITPDYIKDDQKAKDFVRNWISSPEAKNRLKNLGDKSYEQDIKNALTNVNNTLIFSDPDPFVARFKGDMSKSTKNKLVSTLDDVYRNIDEYGKNGKGTLGVTYTDRGLININPAYTKDVTQRQRVAVGDIITHELIHASKLDDLMKNYTPNYDITKLKPKAEFAKFLPANYKEITKNYQNTHQDMDYMNIDGFYPLIMEMRYRGNLKPSDKVTPKNFKSIKDNSTNNPIFKYFDDDKIQWMLNNFVSNDKNINNTAQYGGKFQYKKGGKTQAQYAKERGLKDGHNTGDFDNITPNQARQILHDKHVNGYPLSPAQYKLFGYLSKGNSLKFQVGGKIKPINFIRQDNLQQLPIFDVRDTYDKNEKKRAQVLQQKIIQSQTQLKQGHPETRYEKALREERQRDELQQNSALAQTMGSFTPSGDNRAAGVIGANTTLATMAAAPLMPVAGAFASTLPYVIPSLSAPIAGVEGLTASNLINAGFAYQGAKNIPNVVQSVKQAYNNPTWNNIGNATGQTLLTGLDMLPFLHGASKGLPSLMQDIKLPTASSSQSVISRSQGMDAVWDKTPGYNSHLFNKQSYVPPTNDPKLMGLLSDSEFSNYVSDISQAEKNKMYGIDNYTSRIEGNDFRKNMNFNSQQKNSVKEGWQAAKDLNASADRFIDNTVILDNLSQSKHPLYKNWDDIKKELDVRDMFNINGGKSVVPDTWPMESSTAENLLENYNPSKYNNMDYNTLKFLEDRMHNDRVAASYFYPKAVGENKLVSPVKYDTRLDRWRHALSAVNTPQEQMMMNDSWINHAPWKEVGESYKDLIKIEGLNPELQSDVDKFRKTLQESLNRTNKRKIDSELGHGYGMDLFKGMSPQKLGGNIYQEGGFSKRDLLNFLLSDDKETIPTAPSQDELPQENEQTISEQAIDSPDDDYELSIRIAMGTQNGNPYDIPVSVGNPYKSTGKESPNALATLQEFQPQGFTNLGIWPSAQHLQQNSNSDHNTGKALDLGVNNQVKGDEAVSKLQAAAKEKDIKYIIWNRKIWNPGTNTWKPYNGKDPHTTHIHISFNQ